MIKKIIYIISMLSFMLCANENTNTNTNTPYVFKIKKDSFIVQSSDNNENQPPIQNKNCEEQTVNWLNCSTQITLLNNGQTIEIINTVEGYDGKVIVSCLNGVLSQKNELCEQKTLFNCDDPVNLGKRGTSGECEGLLIVDNTLLRTMVNNNEDYSGNNIYTGQVTDISNLFSNKEVNYNITKWKTDNIINMSGVFLSSTTFNQPIGSWNVSKVLDMSNLFYNASVFNQPLNTWDISNVKNLEGMFFRTIFNQQLNNWNTQNVTNMSYMFYYAANFNQNISMWNVSKVVNKTSFRNNSALGTQNAPLGF